MKEMMIKKDDLMLFLLFGLLLDTITTLFAMEVGHIETNQLWLIHKLIVFFIFSVLKYGITSKNKFIKWFYIVFCVSFGTAWFMAGIHNIYMIILWWGR